MPLTQPLDLQNILVNTLAGSPEIFTFLALIFIAGLAAYFQMPNIIALSMFALFGIFMVDIIGGVYMLIILVAGIAIYYSIKKVME